MSDRDIRVLKASSVLFRSAQPGLEDLKQLQKRGLRSVVNLREEAHDSRHHCEQLNLFYLHLSVADWGLPTPEQMDQFLAFLSMDQHQPALVHCWAGVGRTGVFVSCYRVTLGLEVEDAIRVSDCETPQARMSENQREWIRAFAKDWARQHGPR